ncbi:putative membrane protein [Lishizhenia tianjinensis]|uniref:Putative membrane protein n=1 Tax=Lishizhenia tianjinensis TaxID=477690 RepID=A0A1I7AZP8_9FLAO|nr:carotenoid biosynthesis protein [Lishizhenia tianjinensis]SFT80378.1 putative membrane protein [Lishizhenia tianjinensis]
MIQQLQQYKTILLLGILIIFHTVGLIGLQSDMRQDFLQLSFLNLSLAFIVLLVGREKHSLRFYLYAFFIVLTGMTAEWIGVHTGQLFGNYSYGENLGIKIWGVPIIIGINWLILTMGSTSILAFTKWPLVVKAMASAVLMTALDLLIEPVAIANEYWMWEGDIPSFNYLSWFFISLVLHLGYFALGLAEKNKVAVGLFFILSLFFICLL